MCRVLALSSTLALLACHHGSDSDTDPPVAMTCPAYTGLHGVGSTWSWQSTEAWSASNSGTTAAWDVVIDSITPDATGESVDIAVSATGHYDDADGVEVNSYTTAIGFRCDAQGAWLVSTVVDSTTTFNGSQFVDHNVGTYDTGDLVMIPGAAVGSAWTSHPTGTVTDTFGGTGTFDNTVERSVAAATTTTVPAGDFATLDVVGTSSADNVEQHSFADADAGPVRDGSGELVSVELAP